MPVTIRLARQGAKKSPQYLVVAMSPRGKRDGEYLERLGHYFPKVSDPKAKLSIDLAKFQAWVAKGAQVTKTVGQLVKAQSNSK
jgi:small subunit ribosomal protein S16